jgi:hypothetical protein
MSKENPPVLTAEGKLALDKLYNSRFRTFNAGGTVTAVDFIGSNQRAAFDALARLFNNIELPDATPAPCETGEAALRSAIAAFSKGMEEIQRIAKQPNALAVEEKGPLAHCGTQEAARVYINTLIETLRNEVRDHYPKFCLEKNRLH